MLGLKIILAGVVQCHALQTAIPKVPVSAEAQNEIIKIVHHEDAKRWWASTTADLVGES